VVASFTYVDIPKETVAMPGPGACWIGEEEKREVMEVLDAGWLFRYGDSNNPRFKQKVCTFEKKFAAYCGVDHALATSSGTGSPDKERLFA